MAIGTMLAKSRRVRYRFTLAPVETRSSAVVMASKQAYLSESEEEKEGM
jgi:hypothetical protein